MPPAEEALEAHTVIDISHESLMRVWERLKRWGDEEARSARRYRRLAETAELHAAGDASLLGDLELQVALDWRDRNQPNQTWAMQYGPAFEPVMHFLEASKVARDERRKAAETTALAKVRRTKAVIGALALTVMVLIGWINKGYIKEQYYWHWTMGPSVLTYAQEKEKAAKPGSDFKECATGCPTMVVMPTGSFTMGSPDSEDPQRNVTIAKPFAVGKTEVTFAEWDSCFAGSACQKASDNLWGRGDQPVINVSWDDAKQYVAWLSRITGKEYRLLSEAEWEYAARAGRQTGFSFGDDEAALGEYAWYKANSGKQTQRVGKKKPNTFGLYDMHGNVDEWVEDTWHDNYEPASIDGSPWVKDGDTSRHVVRGGSWMNTAHFLRESERIWLPTDGRYDYLGFRLARTLNP
jgi:formylglycine-generating enzyme required for sulfatase activity